MPLLPSELGRIDWWVSIQCLFPLSFSRNIDFCPGEPCLPDKDCLPFSLLDICLTSDFRTPQKEYIFSRPCNFPHLSLQLSESLTSAHSYITEFLISVLWLLIGVWPKLDICMAFQHENIYLWLSYRTCKYPNDKDENRNQSLHAIVQTEPTFVYSDLGDLQQPHLCAMAKTEVHTLGPLVLSQPFFVHSALHRVEVRLL